MPARSAALCVHSRTVRRWKLSAATRRRRQEATLDSGADEPQHPRRARQTVDEPGSGHQLHPGAHHRNELPRNRDGNCGGATPAALRESHEPTAARPPSWSGRSQVIVMLVASMRQRCTRREPQATSRTSKQNAADHNERHRMRGHRPQAQRGGTPPRWWLPRS